MSYWTRPGVGSAQSLDSWALGSIVAEIAERAGVPEDRIDLDTLEGAVGGTFLDNSNPAYSAIDALSRIFMFDPANYDGKLNFVMRGGDVIADIVTNDLVDDGKDVESTTRRDSISVPRVMHLEYFDLDGGLDPDKQTSDRSLDARSSSEIKTSTAVLMNADDAQRSIIITHKVSIEEQQGDYEFSLPDNWLWLTVGDCIRLNGKRLRIDECELDEGMQNYKAIFDRASAYTSQINGVPAGVPAVPPTLVVGDTVMHFIDSHILRDADDRLGYYVAISGASEAWSGAVVELSTDGGATYLESFDGSAESVMGELLTDLPAHSPYYPDDINTFQVSLLRDDMELEATDLAGMQNRLNLAIVGNELINFGDVDDPEQGVWELGNLLRGRKGSAVASHAAGTRFVLLDRLPLYFIDAELFNLNRELTFRATTFGATSSTTQTITFTGQSQEEREPAYLQAVRDGGNISISWQGVGRIGGGVNVAMGAYFTGYRVTVNGAAQDTTASQLSVTDPGGAVTIQVQQLNQLTGAGPAAEITV